MGHRDLKLENIFRTNSGTIKLFDLGLGKCTSSEFTKSLVGTPLYYSPEEVDLGYKRNALGYTKKSDLHPLAVIYSIFATKYHPFDASTPKKTYANICNKPLQLQTSDDVPYDQRILDLINKLGAKDPAKRPTAQEALDEALAIDEDIKTEKVVEDVIQKIMQDVIQIQIEEDVAKRARFLTWVRSLKNDANFKVQQLEQQLRAVKLANERERTEKEKLKRERDEADKKRNDALQMLEAKRQETLNEEKKKLEDDRKRFEEQQAVARRQLQEQEARFEAMMKEKEREIVENKHRIYKDNWVRDGVLNPKLLVIQKFWKQKVIKINLSSVKIQTLVRKVQAAQRYEKILHGVIALQSVMRMKFVQRSLRTEIPTRKNAIERYDQSRKHALEAKELHVENFNLKNQNEQVTAENASLVRNTEGIHKDIPCPITFERSIDPVVASDGITYDRAAIEHWLATGSTVSPITGAP